MKTEKSEELADGSQIIAQGKNEVKRERRDGKWCYVKHYLEDDWDATREVISKRAELEVQALRLLHNAEGWPRRLGRVNVVEVNTDSGMIVTEEAPGIGLDRFIKKYRRSNRKIGLQVFYLAGRWLRHFQQISARGVCSEPVGSKNPLDLCAYVELRIEELRRRGYRALTDADWSVVMERLNALDSLIGSSDRQLVLAHCDYSPCNILTDGNGVTPIDFQMVTLGYSLLDVTYFLHRLEMSTVYRPWMARPWSSWRRAFTRGYGRTDLQDSALFKSLMIRQYVLRILTYTKRKPKSRKQQIHNLWVLWVLKQKLMKFTKEQCC